MLAIAWVARTATHPVEQSGTVGAAASPKTAPVQKVPAEAPVVRWNITTIPAGAQLLRKQVGAVMGKTPWQKEQAPAVGSEQVRVVAQGFQEQTITLNLAESSERTLSLSPVQAPSAGAVEAKQPPERTRKGKNKATSVHKQTVPSGEKPRITDSSPKVKHSDVLED